MSGEMRRPPQLWEQRLARTTAILGAGISSSGDATAIVPPTPAPGSGGGTEPAPVAPPVGSFSTPSTPTLIGAVTGINVVWNGLNSAGDLWPSDTSFVEVHMSTAGTGFTPDASTLRGRLVRPGGLAVMGLTSGVTYHFRLRGADPAGNFTSPSAAASGSPGLVNAPDIAAGAITANSIVAGTITGWDINSAFLSGGTVSGGYVTGGTIDGTRIRTSASGSRVELGTTGRVGSVDIFDASGNRADFSYSGGQLSLAGATTFACNAVSTIANITANGALSGASISTSGSLSSQTLNVSGANVDFPGITTGSTTSDAGFNGDRLRKKTSSQRYKYDITPLAGTLHPDVDVDKQVEAATVNPTAILDLAVAEFSWLDEGLPTDHRDLGFIAEDVAAKFPIAASIGPDGIPIAVRDTPLLAALLAVVQDMEKTIEDLRARIEALEA